MAVTTAIAIDLDEMWSWRERGSRGPKCQTHNPFNLTDKEWQIADLLLEGLAPQEIGARMGMAGYTVRNHLSSMYRKLDVRSRTGAVVKLWKFKHQAEAGPELRPDVA